MKRSLIAVAVLALLLASTTYASPPRAPRRSGFFWRPLLAWLSFGHQHGPNRMARHDMDGHRPPAFVPDHGQMPPGHRGRPQYGRGRHFGWDNGRHYGWDRNDARRGDRRGSDQPGEGERGNGRGGGHRRG